MEKMRLRNKGIISRLNFYHIIKEIRFMKLELERSEFLKAWQTAEKYTPSKTTMDALNGIRIIASENNTVTLEATDLKSSVKCSAKGASVLEPGVVILNAALFGNMLRKTTEDSITLEVRDDKGTLKAGKSRSRFTVIPTETFPNIPDSSTAEEFCSLEASLLSRLIAEGCCAASAPSDFPKYMGTCLLRTADNNITAVSTDGKRLARSMTPCPEQNKQDDLLLPAQALKELGKIFSGENKVNILADGSTVWFRFNDAEFSVRRIEAAFPKYDKILNEDIKTSIKAAKSSLLSAIERISIIAKNNPANIMAMSIRPEGTIRITARAPELGTVSEILDAEVSGEYMQIGFNASYFHDGIKAVNSEFVAIEFSDEEGQTRIFKDNSKSFLYMLMPIRLSPQDIVNDEEPGDYAVNPEPQQEPESQDNQPHEFGEGNYNTDSPF